MEGEWISLEELTQSDLFKGQRLRVRLNSNFDPIPKQKEPGIKAAVVRRYQIGDVICKAGEYGSTAFLMIEGRATGVVPEEVSPATVKGRTAGSFGRLRRMFTRHRKAMHHMQPSSGSLRSASEPEAPPRADEIAVGEVSSFASLSCDRKPEPISLGPGDLFGIDTCVNFYPREMTVSAETPCVVIEMLRSVLDSLRKVGGGADQINRHYQEQAMATAIRRSPLFRSLSDAQRKEIADHAEFVTGDSDDVCERSLYTHGQAADALFLVHSGTIKLSCPSPEGEWIFAYLGAGAAFGLENLIPARHFQGLQLRSTSHPNQYPIIEVKGSLTFGRKQSCNVSLPSPERTVSREHARLEERGGEVRLIDLDSDNYTLLNGERIHDVIARAGDRITIVGYEFELVHALEATQVGSSLRLASATGLDNFEVIRIPSQTVRPLARENAEFFDACTTAARSLDSHVAERTSQQQSELNEFVALNLYNAQNVLLIDLDRCTRCDECVRACADAHGGVARFTRDGPRLGHHLVTLACRSCTDPKCMIGCPVGSIRRDKSLEIQIEDWCIGCQRCARQCPFGNINMVEMPGAPLPSLADSVTTRLQATVCDLCAGYDGPNCVYACPHDAAIRVNPAEFTRLRRVEP